MRLVYGIATRVGLGEQISEALNGAFVPPGVDDYSDFGDGFGLFGRDDYEDDYDYRWSNSVIERTIRTAICTKHI